ncbi:Prefoldin subunit 6 [Intoshia linei]|uniref:Prefoldin subunit 6 n=1 Tax=Intoshia linei TaxID=1819745 RepID=A0A177B1Y3_9BILA|nr:Prefoldin subunit 6 [Intoshia linei]
MDPEMKLSMENHAKQLNSLQRETNVHVANRQKFDTQLNENVNVIQELERLVESNKVFHMVGPILTRVELGEAKLTVNQRISHIKNNILILDDKLKKNEEEQKKHQLSIEKFKALQEKSNINNQNGK